MNPKERNSLITKTINTNTFFKESKMARSTATAVYFEYGKTWNAFFKDHKNGKPKLKKAKTSKKSLSINNERNTLKLQLSPNESNYAYIKIPNFKDKIKFRITKKTINALVNKDELTKITIKESLKGDWYVVFHFRRPTEKSGLNRSMLLVSHGSFGTMFKSSLERDYPNHQISEVSAHNTSNTCFECKYSDADNRAGYLFHCLSCGHIDHSDINSTYNISQKGIDILKSQGVQVEHLNAFVLKKTAIKQ